MDILRELLLTSKENKDYILVVSDYFTKWAEAFAMPNMEARAVSEFVVQEVVTRFGVLQCKEDSHNTTQPHSDWMVERYKTRL